MTLTKHYQLTSLKERKRLNVPLHSAVKETYYSETIHNHLFSSKADKRRREEALVDEMMLDIEKEEARLSFLYREDVI